MAFSIQKLPFPDALANVPCTVVLNTEGISEDGAPIEAVTVGTMCIFSEHGKRVIDKDGKAITLNGKAIVKGDIAPDLPSISDGTFTVFNRTYEIFAGHRPRNPDGSIHHSEFELL